MPSRDDGRVVINDGQYVLQDGQYVFLDEEALQQHPKKESCPVRVVFRDGRYMLLLHPQARPSLASLRTLLDRDLSALAPRRVQAVVDDLQHALAGVERAAAARPVLSAAQAADKRAAVLAGAHQRVLDLHTEFLVLLARAPTDLSIHNASPRYFLNDDDVDDDNAGGEEEEAKGGDDDDGPWNPSLGYMLAEMCASGYRHGKLGPLQDLFECLVFWDSTRPVPAALLRRFMPRQEPSIADFLQPLLDARVLFPFRPWYQFYCQRRLRGTGRLRPVFASTLRVLAELDLPPPPGANPPAADGVWDGHPDAPTPDHRTPLAHMVLRVPYAYGREEDGSVAWQRVARRYEERRHQGVPVALQECPLNGGDQAE